MRIGAGAYNVAHTYALALPLALFGFLAGRPAILAVALIWIAHIGFDRALGYGLKFPTDFRRHPSRPDRTAIAIS